MPEFPLNDPTARTKFRRAILKWFDANQRDLPWRRNRTPYGIWVSEIMLQQTQVATVIDYYNRFIKRFPTVSKLAAADQSEVLKLWEGLGYYRRARQMHSAAQVVVEQHNGKFPETFDEVLALPGIGRYTAGAILSISLDQKLPILEGNTQRLFARLMQLTDDPKISSSQKAMWLFSESLLPKKRCGDFNQSLMELGSEICTPKSPGCEHCPVISFCPTFANQLQDKIPASSKKMNYESLHEAVVLVSRSPSSKKAKYLVRLCGPDERWTGLWDFPRFELPRISGKSVIRKDQLVTLLDQQVLETTGLKVETSSTSIALKHAVTRFRITLDVFQTSTVSGRLNKTNGQTYQWATIDELKLLAMSTTGRKVASQLPLDTA